MDFDYDRYLDHDRQWHDGELPKTKKIRAELLVIPPPNSFTNGDCMDYLPLYPPNYFELAIVDPPYGNYKIKENKTNKMFENIEPSEAYFSELKRISKNQIIFGVNFFKNVKLDGGRIIWNKLGQDTTRRTQAPTISEAEIAYQSFNNLVNIFSYAWIGNVTGYNYQINSPEFLARIHPTEKPVELYRQILKKYAKIGDRILDTHAGSASCLVACKELDFEYIGFEIDKDYYTIANKRLGRAYGKPELFERSE